MAQSLSRPTRTDAPNQKRNPHKLSFFDLPAEVRNMVYRELVVSKDHAKIYVFVKMKNVDPIDGTGVICLRFGDHGKPALLAVCQEMYLEVQSIYFQENQFCLTENAVCAWAINIFARSVHDIGQIRKISLGRTYYIVDQKVVVRFTAKLQEIDVKGALQPQPRLLISRRDRKIFPGINCVKKGDFAEPCRCEVKRLAFDCQSGANTDGNAIFEFLHKYVKAVTTWTADRVVKECEHCRTPYRH